MQEHYDLIYDICQLILEFYDLTYREKLYLLQIQGNCIKLKKVYKKEKEVI